MEVPDRRAAPDVTPGNPAGPPGMAGQRRTTSGRDCGECHCLNVTKLQGEMAHAKLQIASLKNVFGAKPFIPERAEAGSAMGPTEDEKPAAEKQLYGLAPVYSGKYKDLRRNSK